MRETLEDEDAVAGRRGGEVAGKARWDVPEIVIGDYVAVVEGGVGDDDRIVVRACLGFKGLGFRV